MIVNLTDVAKSKYNKEEFKLVSLLKKIIEDDTYDVSSMKNEDNTTSYSITYTLTKSESNPRNWELPHMISASKMTKDEIESLFKKALKNGDLVGIKGLTNPEEYLDLRFQDFRQDRKNIEGKIGIDFTVPAKEISLKEKVNSLSEQITNITNTLDTLKNGTAEQITNITNTLDALKKDTDSTTTTSTTTNTTVEPTTTTSTTTDEPTTPTDTDDTVDTTTTTTTTTGTYGTAGTEEVNATTTNEDVKGE